jgi:ADP-heptose:LPS heptosyltransferase
VFYRLKNRASIVSKVFKRRLLFLAEYLLLRFERYHGKNVQVHGEDVLLIVKLDGIGDYIVFRDCIRFIKESSLYKRYKILLVGNKAYKDIAENQDANDIQNFLWVDINKARWNLFYRKRLLDTINTYKVRTIFHPTYSRCFYVDKLIKNVKAQAKYAVDGDTRNILSWVKRISNTYYSNILTLNREVIFEFQRNKNVTEQFLHTTIALTKPQLKLSSSVSVTVKKYVVVFPDAFAKSRLWPVDKFAEIAGYLIDNYDYDVVVAGTNKNNAEYIVKKVHSHKLRDATLQTTLIQLAELVHNAELLISNDTSAVHIGVAVNAKVICVSNGNTYGRFVPYPAQVYSRIITLFPEDIENEKLSDVQASEKYLHGSEYSISSISTERVKQAITTMLG